MQKLQADDVQKIPPGFPGVFFSRWPE